MRAPTVVATALVVLGKQAIAGPVSHVEAGTRGQEGQFDSQAGAAE